MRTEIFIELNGVQTDYKVLTDTAKEIWKAEGHLVKDLENMELFFKPDEKKCYYVFNDNVKGHFEV